MEAPNSTSHLYQSESFPKSSRLLKPKDFRFRPYKRLKLKDFSVIVGTSGTGRIGISISKKVLRRAVARNRIRRLIREVYRKNKHKFDGLDMNVSGTGSLGSRWAELKFSEMESELLRVPELTQKLSGKK